MRRPFALGALALCAFGATGCTYTLTNDDCQRYRDRLVEWAKQKGEDKTTEADAFMKSCPGTVVTRSTKKCMEVAGDDKSFNACLE